MRPLSPENKAGLYITAIIHVAVIVLLLAIRVGYEFKRENSFVLDFTKADEAERAREKEQLREISEEKLEELIAAASGIPVKSIAVDRSSLKDDRSTNAEELYREAERLQQELREGSMQQETEEIAVTQEAAPEKKQEPSKPYSGPSVLYWSLDGRKASHMPIPSYRCYGGGEVTVIIAVNNEGSVIQAKVDDAASSRDRCLRDFAVRAARLSKFSRSPEAPARQIGSITYAFISQ